MFSRNIPLFKLDFTGERRENLVEGEYYRKIDTANLPPYYENMGEINDIIFVLRSGPFYTQSLILTRPDGSLLVEGTHYEIFGIASALTAFIKDKEVGMFVKIIDDTVTEWFARYQVVGHFSIFNKDLVDMVNTVVNDERPIYYDSIRNKPQWFNPTKHKHDIRYDIIAFKDLVDGIKSIREFNQNLPSKASLAVEHFNRVIFDRINDFERMLLEYVEKHDSENAAPYGNSHGLLAEQVDLGNVDNFETATLLEILDGFRQDKHLTVDLVKRAIDTIGKDTDNLVRSGSLPVLRYGTNSFIPAPIQGSFEGMGGNNFFAGTNIESSGEGLILMNRADGRVNGLYFMTNENTDGALAPSKWKFTAYRYEHQTATTDGVNLYNIIRGSNGKFLILGGNDANNSQVWYYTLGNGTLDPLRHKLIRIPDEIVLKTTDSLITECYPDRVLLVTRITSSEVASSSEHRTLLMDLPSDSASFSGIEFASDFYAFRMWEYRISESKWRQVIFNYQQVEDTKKITYHLYAPFKMVIKPVSEEYPRGDDKTTGYGLKQFEYIYTHMITKWNMRAWHDQVAALYDTESDKVYCKYTYTAVGEDSRAGTHEGGSNSFGFVLKNRTVSTDGSQVYYDVENRKSMQKLYTMDTSSFGGVSTNIVEGVVRPHLEWFPSGYAGPRTNGWFSSKRWFSIGSSSYGSFPAKLTMHNFNGLGSVENFDNFADARMDENLGDDKLTGSALDYNEINPGGFLIGGHSTFWLQLDPTDTDSYGAVSLFYRQETADMTDDEKIPVSSGLVFRKQQALDSKGIPLPPTKSYTLYPEMVRGDVPVMGYDLNSTVAYITNKYHYTFISNIFNDSPTNRRTEYIKHLMGHQAYSKDNTAVKNSYANTLFEAEHEITKDGNLYTIAPTKTYQLSDAINNVLIPYLVKNAPQHSGGNVLTYSNALATHRIGFTNLQSNKYSQLLIFACISFSITPKTTGAYCSAICFNLTGGTKDGDGVIQNPTVTIVGEPAVIGLTSLTESAHKQAIVEGAQFNRSIGKTVIQSRDLIMQLENGSSHVNLQWDLYLPVKSNNHYPGVSFLVSEDGILGGKSFNSYWTPGENAWFHHPYYGCVSRSNTTIDNKGPRRPNGSAEIGFPYPHAWDTLAQHNFDNTKMVLGNSNYLSSSFSINFSVSQRVTLSGKQYVMPSGIKDLKDVVSDPRNKVFYIYLDFNETGPYYRFTLTPVSETPSRGLISIVKTNGDSIVSIENQNVFTMNGIRISAIRHGSVIPAATGSVVSTGQLEGWVTKNRK